MIFLLQNRTEETTLESQPRHRHGMKEMCLSFPKSTYHLFANNTTVRGYLGFLRDENAQEPKKTFPCIRFVPKAIEERLPR